MKRLESYNTKQREAVLGYIASLDGGHVTAAQIVAHFEREHIHIGRTTVYRLLDKLTESGKVRKYSVNDVAGSCYQYIDYDGNCTEHLHMKCESCGKLLHISCDMLNEMQRHFFDRHSFKLNQMKTVLYGTCDSCL